MPIDKEEGSNLSDIADQVMIARGFLPSFPDRVNQEVAVIQEAARPHPLPAFRDMRDRQWISIDNDDSRDLDQLTFAEKTRDGKDLIYIAVADVDGLVKQGSNIDGYASHNTTSIYTPTKIYPMLPIKLSTNLTSLNEDVDRCAIVTEIEVTVEGEYLPVEVYAAQVRNQAKLAYDNVTAHLEQGVSLPQPKANLPWISEQIKLQDEIAQRIKSFRHQRGSLIFGTFEVESIVVRGVAIGLEKKVDNRAHQLIENFMIAANVSVTRFLTRHRLPTLRRVVRTPQNWDRIVYLAKMKGGKLPSQPDAKALQAFLLEQQSQQPESFPDLSLSIIKLIGRGEYVALFPGERALGHFDLAILDYAHTTAPNRRFPDVVMQRLVRSQLFNLAVPYKDEELVAIAANCTQKETDASKVERRMQKSAAAQVMAKHIGEKYDALVTGASAKGVWVRIANPPIEGKVVQGMQGVEVGDRITVRLEGVDIVQGFIDFARIR